MGKETIVRAMVGLGFLDVCSRLVMMHDDDDDDVWWNLHIDESIGS